MSSRRRFGLMVTVLAALPVLACGVLNTSAGATIEAQSTKIAELSQRATNTLPAAVSTIPARGAVASPVPSQSSESAIIVTPTSTVPEYTLIPFGFMLSDAGDGWNDGQVNLAFENMTNHTVSMTNKKMGQLQVETKEGATYPASLVQMRGGMGLGEGGNETNEISLFGERLVPPGFRFFVDASDKPDLWYVVRWRSAAAATPQRISFVDHPEMSFDLPSQSSPDIPFPYESPPVGVVSFSSLSQMDLVDTPGGILMSLTGRCATAVAFEPDASWQIADEYYLEFTAKNRDQFNDQKELVLFRPTLFYNDGTLLERITPYFSFDLRSSRVENALLTLGPGQDVIGYLDIGPISERNSTDPPMLVIWDPSDAQSWTLFDMSECMTK